MKYPPLPELGTPKDLTRYDATVSYRLRVSLENLVELGAAAGWVEARELLNEIRDKEAKRAVKSKEAWKASKTDDAEYRKEKERRKLYEEWTEAFEESM